MNPPSSIDRRIEVQSCTAVHGPRLTLVEFSPYASPTISIGLHDADVASPVFEPFGDLHEAAGIAGSEELGARFEDGVYLALEEAFSHVGLEDIVDAGAAAADLRVADVKEFASPGTWERICRGWLRTPCPWARWQASW